MKLQCTAKRTKPLGTSLYTPSLYSSVFDNLIVSVFVSSHMNKEGLASYNLNLHCAWSVFVQCLKSLGSSPSSSELCYLNHKFREFWYLSRFPWWLVGFMLQCTAKDNQNRIYSYQPHLFLHCRPWWGKCQYLCRYFNLQCTVSIQQELVIVACSLTTWGMPSGVRSRETRISTLSLILVWGMTGEVLADS